MHAAGGVHAAWAAGIREGKGSANRPAGEHELQLAEDQIPVLTSGTPALCDALRSQVKHSAQRIIVREAGLVFGDLPKLAVETLNDVGRVYDFPDLGRVFIERAQNLPIFLPAF